MQRIGFALAVIGIGFGVAATGCGDDGTGAVITAEQASASWAAAYCAKVDMCAPPALKLVYGDLATCTARVKLAALQGLMANGTAAKPAQIDACAKAVAPSTCDDLLAGKLPTACDPIPGTLADGAACADHGQCKSTWCTKTTGSSCGACGPIPGVGASCATTECGRGLVCNKQKTCAKPAARGEACNPDTTPCIPTSTCFNGTCAAPLDLGATCDPQGMTTAGCDNIKGLYCNGAMAKCASIALAKAGESCGFISMGIVGCEASAKCKIATGSIMGVCVATAADGATCNDAMGPTCLPPAVCDTGVCKIPNASMCQ